jgi:hypothetical protein
MVRAEHAIDADSVETTVDVPETHSCTLHMCESTLYPTEIQVTFNTETPAVSKAVPALGDAQIKNPDALVHCWDKAMAEESRRLVILTRRPLLDVASRGVGQVLYPGRV